MRPTPHERDSCGQTSRSAPLLQARKIVHGVRGIRLTGAGVNKQALRATGAPDHIPPGDDSWVAGEKPYVSLHVLSDATPPAPAIARARSLPSSSI